MFRPPASGVGRLGVFSMCSDPLRLIEMEMLMRTSSWFSVLMVWAFVGCAMQTGEDDRVEGAVSALTADSWSPVGTSGTTDATPEPVSFNGRLYAFAKGVGDDRIYVNSTPDGGTTTWSGWSAVGTKLTDVAVTPIKFGLTLYLFAVTQSTHAIAVNTTTNGTVWSGWTTPFTGSTDQPVGAAVFGGRLYVVLKGLVDHGIYVTSTANGTSWSGFSSSLGITDVSPRIVANAAGNRLVIFIKGQSDSRMYTSTSSNGSSWGAWTPFGFGRTTSRALRVANYGGDMYVASSGFGDSQVYVTASRDLTSWSDWFQLPTSATYAGNLTLGLQTNQPVGLAPFGTGSYFLAAKASDNRIHEEAMPAYHLPFSSSGWSVGNGNWDDPISGHGHAAGNTGDQAYAFDFLHAQGASVVAMRTGWIIAYREDLNCNTGLDARAGTPGYPDLDPTCFGAGNFVWIRHPDGSVASYLHLQQGSVVGGAGRQSRPET